MSESLPQRPAASIKDSAYLLALALAVPLLLFAHNLDLVKPDSLLIPLFLSLATPLLALALLACVGLRRMALRCASMILLLLFFSYGHLYNTLSRLLFSVSVLRFGETDSVLGLRSELHAGLSFLYLLFLWLSIAKLKRAANLKAIESFFAAFCFSLLFIAVVSLLPALFSSSPSSEPGHASTANPAVSAPIGQRSEPTPDIYYIILDGYARADTLATYYQFDNSPFLSALEGLGFRISPNSRSNYSWTFLSLPSSLNMRYLPELTEGALRTSSDRRLPYFLMRKHALMDLVRAQGYRFIQIGSTWGGTIDNQYADSSISCQRSLLDDEFLRSYIEASWLRVLESFVAHDIAECTLFAFDQLQNSAKSKAPKFVFAHFIPPHHPYLFDRQGTILQHVALSNQLDLQNRLWGDSAAYLAQIEFVNQRILSALKAIIADSAQTPIIILQSDHGPHLPQLAPQEQRTERLKNFTAALTPGHPGLLPAAVTPVNIFRHIANAYFAAQLPILEQHSYASQYEKPYAIEEVSP
jgi:hypothetical protein